MNKISKTKIEKRMQGKTNPELVETIIKLKKINPNAAKILAFPKRKSFKINLEEIDKITKEGEKILVPGKVLGAGKLNKKVKIVAFSASADAREKIREAKGEYHTILEEIGKNPKLNELKMLDLKWKK